MFKNWFLLASVSCGVGFGSTFLISRNLQQSTLAGLGTVPAVAASLTILSRQRREEIDRQVAKSKQQLQLTNASCSEISAHRQRLQEEIERQVAKSRLGLDDAQRQEQLFKDRCREISLHGKTLQAELETAINSLVMRKQTQESSLIQLDAKVLDRQNNLQTTQAELTRIQNQRQSEINSGTSRLNDSARQSNLELQRIREEIRQYSAIKEQLKVEITDLQNQEESLQAEIATQSIYRTEVQQKISVLEEHQDALELEICNRQQVKEDINSEIIKLEESIFLFSGHSIDEVPNIKISDLHRKWQDLSEQIPQLEEERNRLSIAVDDLIQSTDGSKTPKKWENHLIFENNPHLRVLQHIDVHGNITELDVGTAREQRQFNIEFCKYLKYLPFSISNREGRYLKIAKESIVITDLQDPDNRAQIEQEIDKLSKQKERLLTAIDELSRLLEDDLKQQAIFRQELDHLLLQKQGLSREITINREILDQIRIDSNQESNEHQSNACINNYDRRCSCGSTPMPGELFCYGCSC